MDHLFLAKNQSENYIKEQMLRLHTSWLAPSRELIVH